MTQRSPIYTRIGPLEQPKALLTWTNGVQQGSQPIPFIPRQWDWTTPTLRKGSSNALLSWVVQPQIAPAVVVSPPFNQASWPNPPLRAQNPDLRTWLDAIPQTALSLTLPPRQPEWPNPVTARSIDRTWIYSQQIPVPVVVAMPVQVTDWPNPVARARATLSWSFSIQQGLQPTPFIARQSDWPNPPRKPLNLSLRSWTQSLSVPAVGRPVRQLDWPNPGQQRRALALLVDYAPNTTARGIPAAPGTILLETIPYLIGSEEAQARQMLGSIYMVVAVIGTGGTVVSQDVAPFTLAARGTVVTITMGGAIYTPPRGGGNLPYNLH